MKLAQLVRRRRRLASGGHVLTDLRDLRGPDVDVPPHGLPPGALHGVRTFYDMLHGATGPRRCEGTSCWQARGGKPSRGQVEGLHCLGRCYAPPATSGEDAPPIPRTALGDPVVLRGLVEGPELDPWELYELPSGEAILEAVDDSGLCGRGGAAFPTARKWRAARDHEAPDRVVVANGDEGDPGSYIDRLLLEEAPHAVLAGMLACARAIGARRGVVFIRGEYPEAPVRLRAAIAEARARGVLGDELEVEVVTGAGSYVAGEETALLNAIEGLRAEPWPKPPYPAERGLYGLPTVVQNVETLAVVPQVVRRGAPGTRKAFCLNGVVSRPGVVEARLGTTLRALVDEGAGGIAPGKTAGMALVGGPMGRVVPAERFDVELSYEGLPGMGHGGVVVLDESVSPRALAEHLFDFARRESCGSCTPCRVGTARLASCADRPALERLLDTLEMGSLCGFGSGVPRPIRDLLEAYGEEVLAC